MFRFSKLTLAVLALATGFLVVGCQSGGAQEPASHAMPSEAVQCDKCQVTWVKVPSLHRGESASITEYDWVKHDPCPDCKSAVANFFSTGKLEHGCKACGGIMAACEGH